LSTLWGRYKKLGFKLRERFYPVKPVPPLYEALNTPHAIRILHLNPASSFTAPLTASFSIEDLDDAPVYDALSYVWGYSANTGLLLCNEIEVGITRSVDTAFRHVRSKVKVVKIWVDSLCINQNQLIEKNHQVRNLGNIYRKAKRVIVWLSPELWTGQQAFKHSSMQDAL